MAAFGIIYILYVGDQSHLMALWSENRLPVDYCMIPSNAQLMVYLNADYENT